MKEAIVKAGPQVSIVDAPIPQPNEDQVVIKVVVSGSNPKDWKVPEWFNKTMNSGDDIAGIVHQVGANVSEFKPGDRVFAFHEMLTPGGSFAEYAVAWQHTTAHLPKNVSFEEGAAVPLAALTAAVGLYRHLGVPQPWTPVGSESQQQSQGLVIYGAASAVGIYALQLALLANVHPLICVAGRAKAYVESFLDPAKGDVVIDYRDGDDAVVQAIQRHAGRVRLAYDAVSEKGSYVNLAKALGDGATICVILPVKDEEVSAGVTLSKCNVGAVHKDAKDLGYVYMRYFAKGLLDGSFKAQRQEVVPGGLAGVQAGLANLKAGKASAVKYVFRIEETNQ